MQHGAFIAKERMISFAVYKLGCDLSLSLSVRNIRALREICHKSYFVKCDVKEGKLSAIQL